MSRDTLALTRSLLLQGSVWPSQNVRAALWGLHPSFILCRAESPTAQLRAVGISAMELEQACQPLLPYPNLAQSSGRVGEALHNTAAYPVVATCRGRLHLDEKLEEQASTGLLSEKYPYSTPSSLSLSLHLSLPPVLSQYGHTPTLTAPGFELLGYEFSGMVLCREGEGLRNTLIPSDCQ